MILGKNPIQGGSVVVRLTFKDESGQVYVPVEGSVYYILLGFRRDNGLWGEIKPWVSLPSESVVDIVLQGADLELFPEYSLKRRVLIQWKYLRGGEEVIGRDVVDFEVVPLPVSSPPLSPVPV
jgi:hypothetical protein